MIRDDRIGTAVVPRIVGRRAGLSVVAFVLVSAFVPLRLFAQVLSPPENVATVPYIVPGTAIAADTSNTPYVYAGGLLYRKTSLGWQSNPVDVTASYEPTVFVDHTDNVTRK